MADDNEKKLSETIIYDIAVVSQKWEAMKPIAAEATSLVKEYSEWIDGFGKVFTVVGFFWGIYSDMEKAKENAAHQQAMFENIIKATSVMITRAVADLKHHMDRQEVRDVVSKGHAIQDSFRHSVIPFAKTYPMTDLSPVVAAEVARLMLDADEVIDKMKDLINDRADQGDGAAILILYRNMHAVVQCKLTMYRWLYGLTEEVITMTEEAMTSLIQIWVPVVQGLERMSDNSFSPGIVYFHVGGDGRPEFTKYSYYYKGKAQPGSSSNMAIVSQAFIAARKAERSNAIPQELFEWNKKPYEIMQQFRRQHKKIRGTENLHIVVHGTDTYLVGNCLDNDQHWNERMLRLDSYLGDNGGHFQWGGSEFTKSARNIRFNSAEGATGGPVLRAELQDGRGNFLAATVNLAEGISNRDGYLQFTW
ncbi:hypothetical protein IFM53868_10555 [Aspergillus udagawae]|uniref:Cyanovirin-N domain-containing protein n=1 Tax=Aspergillus udagawae TaxID=91492 RepID=A0ABQ1BEH5_9EURO|nr:hypothetical protein IFM53868_10555 [Aspergillus udagawae]GFG19513.1 hypothetical protein IFM5058_10168 [Aspergillus udagawae]